MCLSIVTKKCRKPYKGSGTAYKIMWRDNRSLKFQFYPLNGVKPDGAPRHRKPPSRVMIAPRGRWLKSFEDTVLSGNDVTHYRSGFHLYTDRGRAALLAAQMSVNDTAHVIEVIWRGLKVVGIQGENDVIVVDEIYIPRGQK
jgi:hypothetical protein